MIKESIFELFLAFHIYHIRLGVSKIHSVDDISFPYQVDLLL